MTDKPRQLTFAEAFVRKAPGAPAPTRGEAETEAFMRGLDEGRATYCSFCGYPYYVAVGHECVTEMPRDVPAVKR
jgi:hypothetical protein